MARCLTLKDIASRRVTSTYKIIDLHVEILNINTDIFYKEVFRWY